MNERRGAAPAPPPLGPPLAGGRRAQSAAATSAAFGPDGGSLPEARRPALTVLLARRRRSRRSRVSERAGARALRAVAPGLGLRGLGGSGFGMLRRPRARASLPHTHTLGAPAGGGQEWDSDSRPAETRRRDRRVSPAQRAVRAVTGRSVREGSRRPRRPPLPTCPCPLLGPGAWEAAGMCRKARTRMARTAASVLAVGTRLGGRGVAVFSWSPSAPPLSLWHVSRARLSLCVWIGSGVRFQPWAESQVVASSLWMGDACAPTGRRIKDPPLFLETFCCVCVL